MKLKKFVRLDNRGALEITKSELINIVEKYPCLVDESEYNSFMLINESDDVVGYLAAAELSVLEKIRDGLDVNENDFWFINKKCVDQEYTYNNIPFGVAYELSKLGYIIYRYGWNGNKRKDDKDFKLRMFVVYVPSSEIDVRENTPYWNAGIRGSIKIDSHLDLYTPAGTVQPGWVASQADIAANDWMAIKR